MMFDHSNPIIRILHVYPDYLNDVSAASNLAVLKKRAEWFGVETAVTILSFGDVFTPGEHDLLFLGHGPEHNIELLSEQINRSAAEAIKAASAEGTTIFAIGAGYQLLGTHYLDAQGTHHPGVGLFDMSTAFNDAKRLVGNIAIECNLPAIADRAAITTVVTGFENHAELTTLGTSARALGRVLHGYGNNGQDKHEGCRLHHAVGTNLHGPILAYNPELTDWIIAAALVHAHGAAGAKIVDENAVPPAVRALEQAERRTALARAKAEKH